MCIVVSYIWYFSNTEHFFRICTFVSQFRAYLRFLENLSLEYNLQSNCLFIEKAMRAKGLSVCLPGALSDLSLGLCNSCGCDFK